MWESKSKQGKNPYHPPTDCISNWKTDEEEKTCALFVWSPFFFLFQGMQSRNDRRSLCLSLGRMYLCVSLDQLKSSDFIDWSIRCSHCDLWFFTTGFYNHIKFCRRKWPKERFVAFLRPPSKAFFSSEDVFSNWGFCLWMRVGNLEWVQNRERENMRD